MLAWMIDYGFRNKDLDEAALARMPFSLQEDILNLLAAGVTEVCPC